MNEAQPPNALLVFLKHKQISNAALETGFATISLCDPDDLGSYQAGYRCDSRTGEKIKDWDETWTVFADIYGDPVIYDSKHDSVLFDRHGKGFWRPSTVFESLQEAFDFIDSLREIYENAGSEFYDDDLNIQPQYLRRARTLIQEMISVSNRAAVTELLELDQRDHLV
jgi:hypothetical protein